jgi:hypothetical protein
MIAKVVLSPASYLRAPDVTRAAAYCPPIKRQAAIALAFALRLSVVSYSVLL